MSYDISVGVRSENCTTNLRPFFKAFDIDPSSWDGEHRHIVGSRINRALKRIHDENLTDLKCRYDPPNGWGTVEGGIEFLKRCRDSALSEIPAIVKVSW